MAAVLSVVKYGEPILRAKVPEVVDFGEVKARLDEMFATMYAEEGIGLAANQVGIDMNFAVLDISHAEEEEYPRVIVNPRIVDKSGSYAMEEGCLSIPEIRATITRPESIRLHFQDENGIGYEENFSGLLSRVIQHEVDHLNGVFFIDYLSPAKWSVLKKRLNEISTEGVPSTGIIL